MFLTVIILTKTENIAGGQKCGRICCVIQGRAIAPEVSMTTIIVMAIFTCITSTTYYKKKIGHEVTHRFYSFIRILQLQAKNTLRIKLLLHV